MRSDRESPLGIPLAAVAALILLAFLAFRHAHPLVPFAVAGLGFLGADAVGEWLGSLLLERARAEPQLAVVAVSAPFLAAILAGHATLLLRERRFGFAALEVALGLLFGAAMLELGLREESARLRITEDSRMHAWFEFDGGELGTRSAEALARRIHPRLCGIATPDPDRPRVVLLGSSNDWEAANLQFSVAPHLLGLLQGRFGSSLDVVPLRALPGSALQQIRMFERFYPEPQPEVVVLGLHAFEFEEDPLGPLAPRFDAEPAAPPWHLAEALWPSVSPAPATNLDELMAEVDGFVRRCRERKLPLLLTAFPGTVPALVDAVKARVAEWSVPFLEVSPAEPSAQAAQVCTAILDLVGSGR